MPLPFDMLAVMLFFGYYTETPVKNPPPLLTSMGIVLAAAAALLLACMLINRISVRRFRRPGQSQPARRAVAGRAGGLVRVALTIAYITLLEESAFPFSMAKALDLTVRPEAFFFHVFGLIPYVLLFFAAWLPMYPLHRITTPGLWTRRSYILNKARYNLYVLLAWLPFAFLADWLGEFIVILPVLFLAAAWAFPILLARAWGCKRLPEGEARDAVRRMEEKAGVRFSRAYLWEPGGGHVQNAAAVGILPPFRYLFLTPALIRGMNTPELEAVILHELGHIKKKHLLFYLFTSLAGINAAVMLGYFLPVSPAERFAVTAALTLLYFRFVFGWLSRNMERQADLFALEKSGSAKGLAIALEKLGISAGNIRLASSWHHLGIAERVDFLRRADRRPELMAAHNAAVAQLMLSGYLAAAVVIAGMAWMLHGEYTREARRPAVNQEAAQQESQAHWRRVLRVVPDNPRAHLELAHSLARNPERRDEAKAMAERAIRLEPTAEIRDAAANLLLDLAE